MKLSVLAAVLATASGALAHTHVWSVWVNGQDQGDGRNQYIRSPPNNSPVKDVNSGAIRCNVNDRTVSKWVSAKAGDQITFEWYHDNRADDILASSHKGPVMVYMASASGGGWTKLCQEGLSGGTWATDRLISNKGKHSCTIPSSVKAGDYLLRAEVIGLHEGETLYTSNSARGAQFYPSCTQIRLTSGGSTTLPGGVSFPGTYKANDPGIYFNVYNSPTSYTIPGGAVWSGAGGGGTTNPPPTTSPPPSSGSVPKYGQCGGIGYSGPTACASGSTCTKSNDYYSQCL